MSQSIKTLWPVWREMAKIDPDPFFDLLFELWYNELATKRGREEMIARGFLFVIVFVIAVLSIGCAEKKVTQDPWGQRGAYERAQQAERAATGELDRSLR